ncbi:MAG: hypothetical protein GX891_05245 [Clostridiales bacterium]|nr:hypothetical protein [Clostridiales bacterium]
MEQAISKDYSESEQLYRSLELVYYTPAEEVANSLSHLAGAVLGLIALGVLTFLANGVFEILAGVIFGLGLAIPFLNSVIYHGLRNLKLKSIWRKIDHAGIGFIVFSCVAPMCLLGQPAVCDYIILSAAFCICIINLILCYTSLKKFSRVALLFDFVIAALGLASYILNRHIICDLSSLFYLLGALLNILGAVFYGIKRKFAHLVFHIFTLLGAIALFFATYYLMNPSAAVIF